MLFDTDVIIWYLRGNKNSIEYIEGPTPISISAVTYMEVIRGLKNKERLHKWKSLVASLDIKIIPITESISAKAMFWTEQFTLSHGLEPTDALIAATAHTHELTLFSGNAKDFKYLPDLKLKTFKE